MTYFYSPLVDAVESAVQAITTRYEDLAKKHGLLRKQYGVASRTIHELRGEVALLRAQLKEQKDNPVHNVTIKNLSVSEISKGTYSDGVTTTLKPNRVKTAHVFGDPTEEPPHGLTLRSTRPLQSYSDLFELKSLHVDGLRNKRWWSFINGKQHTWADWSWWVNNYGPFTEVVDD